MYYHYLNMKLLSLDEVIRKIVLIPGVKVSFQMGLESVYRRTRHDDLPISKVRR